MEPLLEKLKTLTELNGASGAEDQVRDYILSQIKEGDVTVDALGNVLVHKKGKKPSPRIMVSAHMDEVALMVTKITDDGYLKFKPVGGIEPKVLYSKTVTVGGVYGVIAGQAIHLQDKEARNKPIPIDKLTIDIGASSKEEVPFDVGTYAYFTTPFERLGERTVKAKALDDRVGCAVLLSLIEKDFDADITFCFLTREEVGLKGAKPAANRVAPDIALVIEGTVCSDIPNAEPHEYVTQLGGGAVMPFMDRTFIADHDLFSRIKAIAEAYRIPLQHKRTVAGGTDAGAIHRSRAGIKTAVLAVPCRYIHSPAGIMDTQDFFAVHDLAEKFLKECTVHNA